MAPRSTGGVTADPVESVTPSGLEIRFQSRPKRCYWIKVGRKWIEVPSVTTVLSVLDKPALAWWGMRTGAEGVMRLLEAGVLEVLAGEEVTYLAERRSEAVAVDLERLVNLLTEHQLTVNHRRDSAANRGLSAHDAFELWAHTGLLPDIAAYPEEEHGYLAGLHKFAEDVESETEGCEVMIGSRRHRFAGRYDWRGLISGDLVERIGTARKEPVVVRWDGERTMLDLKTSKGTYPSHFLQLEGYEGGSIESGWEPTSVRAVLHVTAAGEYELVRSEMSFSDFLAVRKVYRVLEGK